MRTAHQRSGQSCCRNAGALLLLLSTAGCLSTQLPPSIWPPADFLLVVEQVRIVGAKADVVKRFTVRADGLVVYATSSTSLEGGVGVRLPVFERVAAYQMVPECTRALARRIERCGVLDLDGTQGERGAGQELAVALNWRAFGRSKVITARGPVHGAFAEILAVVGAHLPAGEGFGLPGVAERGVAAVLHDVPTPKSDPVGSLVLHRTLLEQRPSDRALLLDTFALACQLGERELAESLLRQWTAATTDERREQELFPDGEQRLTPDLLERLLPRG